MLLTDFVCLYIYEFWLSLLLDCSEFGNFVITLIHIHAIYQYVFVQTCSSGSWFNKASLFVLICVLSRISILFVFKKIIFEEIMYVVIIVLKPCFSCTCICNKITNSTCRMHINQKQNVWFPNDIAVYIMIQPAPSPHHQWW